MRQEQPPLIGGDRLERVLVQRRWHGLAPGYKLVAYRESKLQNLAIGERFDQYTLYSNGQVTVSFPDPTSFIPLAHFWMCQHPDPKRVLAIGGGAEGLLAEILKHPVQRVDYLEPDPQQIELIRPFLTGADRAALADPRVAVHHLDPRFFIKRQRDAYDLVIARLPEPTSALRARLYTVEFFAELAAAMTDRAVLCFTATATPGNLTTAAAEYLASIRATLAPHFDQIVIGWSDPAQVLAATADGLIATDSQQLAHRAEQRRIEPSWVLAWLEGATDWLEPGKLAQRAAEIAAVSDPAISTDLHPQIYLQRLALWEQMTGGPKQRLVEQLRQVRSAQVLGILAVAAVLIMALTYVRAHWPARRRGNRPTAWLASAAVTCSIAATGLVTMSLSIIWLFAFQNLYGYVYQRIGWIIALFMGGMVLGGQLVNRALSRAHPASGAGARRWWAYLVLVDGALALLAASIPMLLTTLNSLASSAGALRFIEVTISAAVALTGLLGGAAFPLAAALRTALGDSTGHSAAAIEAADHGGACVGALLCGIVLVPVLGTGTAAWTLAAIKVATVLLLILSWSSSRIATNKAI